MDQPVHILHQPYASPSRLLSCILLKSSRHSTHTNIGRHNHMITLISDKHFGLVDTTEGMGEGESSRKKVASF